MTTTVILDERARAKAIADVGLAPIGWRVTVAEPTRSDDQNRKWWAMLGDIAKQKTHHGLKLRKEDWAILFLDALKREVRMAPNLDGTGFVRLDRSTKDLGVRDGSDFIEVIYAWGNRESVVWSEPVFDQHGTRIEVAA